MRYDAAQFGSFDGLDNRREIMILFQRLGDGLPDQIANERRAAWLQSLIPHSVSGMATSPLIVQPCDAIEAYRLFVAITGVLGVPIYKAAKMLDEEVRRKRGVCCHY